MNILVIGSGGREHALAWKALNSAGVKGVFVAPGNAGTAQEPGIENVELNIGDFEGLASFAEAQSISLTIVGPEQPLVDGIVDFFTRRELPIFGPSQGAAQLEASKAFTKDFLARHKIPTGDYQCFDRVEPALAYVQKKGAPIVIKADGLAAGKGVIVATNITQAEDAIKDMLAGNKFGEAGHRVVVEEFLEGEEASFIVMVDGTNVLPMATSQDHKRVGNGDTGPNTGGMGAYSPAPVVTPCVHKRIMDDVILPTVKGMSDEGNAYTGFLYAGLMITADGSPKVIEYNCRFGDPETQPIMMRLRSDLVALCLLALQGRLHEGSTAWDPRPAVGIVLASRGYPDRCTSKSPIEGLATANAIIADGKVFHAGSALENGRTVISGGRVLCATAMGDNVTEAQKNAYEVCKKIVCEDLFYRTDIAWRAIQREQGSQTDRD